MNGIQIGTLELRIYNETDVLSIQKSSKIIDSSVGNFQVIWSKTGRQKNDWLFANVTLPIGNYTVAKFEAYFKYI